MANQDCAAATTASQVGAAVIGEVAGRVVSKVIDTLGKRPVVDAKKLQRLEILVVKLRSTVEVSEKLGAESASLLQWRDRLKEAASEGHQVLLSFQPRATECDAAADADEEDHGGSKSGAVSSFPRNALLGMARGLRSTAKALLFGGDGAEKLNSAVDKLEQECADIGEFIRLVQIEASSQANMAHRPRKRKRSPSPEYVSASDDCDLEYDDEDGDIGDCLSEMCEEDVDDEQGHGDGIVENHYYEEDRLAYLISAATLDDGKAEEPAMSMAVERLKDVLAGIARAVEIADGRELIDLEWLAEWADILRDSTQRGHSILGIYGDAKSDKQAAGGEHEEDQLRSAVDSMENLALDVECFISLVSLCPSI
ncbi:hypothetical protein ACP70R_025725 [Stipagrostis hirtigluma subsp. patula]